jgi:hypothetical protein
MWAAGVERNEWEVERLTRRMPRKQKKSSSSQQKQAEMNGSNRNELRKKRFAWLQIWIDRNGSRYTAGQQLWYAKPKRKEKVS